MHPGKLVISLRAREQHEMSRRHRPRGTAHPPIIVAANTSTAPSAVILAATIIHLMTMSAPAACRYGYLDIASSAPVERGPDGPQGAPGQVIVPGLGDNGIRARGRLAAIPSVARARDTPGKPASPHPGSRARRNPTARGHRLCWRLLDRGEQPNRGERSKGIFEHVGHSPPIGMNVTSSRWQIRSGGRSALARCGSGAQPSSSSATCRTWLDRRPSAS